MKDKISKLQNVYKKYGFWTFLRKCYDYLYATFFSKFNLKEKLNKDKYINEISQILKNNKYDRIIVWRNNFGFNGPLYQRPQHIASNLAKQKCLVFYEVTTMTDKVKSIKEESKNLYLVNFNNKTLKKVFDNLMNEINKPKYLQIYATDWLIAKTTLEEYINHGYKIIYEYIDELSPEINGTKNLSKNVIDKYEFAIKNKDVFIVATAENLKNDIIKKRGKKNLVLSSNGVDYEFFRNYDNNYETDNEFNKVVDIGKPIICYYGALAKWFDYELIKKIDSLNKYSIVLFGVKYDDSFDENGIERLDNVYFMGAKDYKVLKYYAKKCDVLTIPFVINDITESTSPVKIFEYMALSKPIVVTDLKECRQYKSAMIAHSHEEFLNLLEDALKIKNNKKYLDTLNREAKENDWSYKAKAIIDMIRGDE